MRDKLRKRYIATLLAFGAAALVFVIVAGVSGDFDLAAYSTLAGLIIWLALDHVEISANLEMLMEYLGVEEEE